MKKKPILVYETNGTVTRYSSVNLAARQLGLTKETVAARIRGKVQKEERIFVYESPDGTPPDLTQINRLKKEKYIPRSVDVPFVKIKGVICTTDCPYRKDEHPIPKVGSVLCHSCPSHQGINHKTATVRCSNPRKGHQKV